MTLEEIRREYNDAITWGRDPIAIALDNVTFNEALNEIEGLAGEKLADCSFFVIVTSNGKRIPVIQSDRHISMVV